MCASPLFVCFICLGRVVDRMGILGARGFFAGARMADSKFFTRLFAGRVHAGDYCGCVAATELSQAHTSRRCKAGRH